MTLPRSLPRSKTVDGNVYWLAETDRALDGSTDLMWRSDDGDTLDLTAEEHAISGL